MYGPDYEAYPVLRRALSTTPMYYEDRSYRVQKPRPYPYPTVVEPYRGSGRRGSVLGEFEVQYLGSVPLVASHDDRVEPSMEDVGRAVSFLNERSQTLRMEGGRLKTYLLQVHVERISFDRPTGYHGSVSGDIQHIPINMVNFVAADPLHETIFSLVARSSSGNRFMCHVFECRSKSQNSEITRTVSMAFSVSYEKWLRVEENQRRLEERRELDMGGEEYFQEWDDAPFGMPLYNISGYYNTGRQRPRKFIRPRDEMPVVTTTTRRDSALPDRLIMTRNQPAPVPRQEIVVEPEPYTMRFSYEEEQPPPPPPEEEVYIRQDLYNRGRGQYFD